MSIETLNRDLGIIRAILKDKVELSNFVVAGGAIRDSLAYTQYKDIDLYCKNPANFYEITGAFFQLSISPIKMSNKVYTYVLPGVSVPIQVINMYIGSSDEIIAQFDFNINSTYIELFDETNKVHYGTNLNNELKLNLNVLNKNTLLERTIRMLEKGYTIHVDELEKVCQTVIKSLRSDGATILSQYDICNYGEKEKQTTTSIFTDEIPF